MSYASVTLSESGHKPILAYSILLGTPIFTCTAAISSILPSALLKPLKTSTVVLCSRLQCPATQDRTPSTVCTTTHIVTNTQQQHATHVASVLSAFFGLDLPRSNGVTDHRDLDPCRIELESLGWRIDPLLRGF
jgi:hypothetical protein